MDEFTYSSHLSHRLHRSPVLVVIEHHVLTRTCILGILKREFAEFEVVEFAATGDLTCISARDIRLVMLNIGDKLLADPTVEQRLMLLEELCPGVPVALLSSRDDEDTAATAMQRGVRCFFSTSISVEVAIAGLRLVLAGGVYRPLPIVSQLETPPLRRLPPTPICPNRRRSAMGTAARLIWSRGRLPSLRLVSSKCSKGWNSVFPTS